MFVKKLVEKVNINKHVSGNSSDRLKASDVNPRLIFHQGVPSGGVKFAYDNIQKILALSTKDGLIKLIGKDNAQVLLESTELVPSKFLQFIHNRGIVINVTSNNHIEVWDIDKKLLSNVYNVREEITCFAVIQNSLYMYVGVSNGNISVLKLDRDRHVVRMNYTIPLSASYGITTDVSENTVVTHILSQPAAESKRESRCIFRTGGNMSQSLHNEAKKVSCACWVCPFGSKVVVGYNNGELFIWSIPSLSTGNGSAFDYSNQNTPIFKLNLRYKSDKICVGSVKWIYAEGKASRLYVMGTSDNSPSNLLQVVLLNEHTESRTIKLGLHLSECCIDMEIISTSHKQNSLLLLGKSGHLYAYDDSLIERYLLQCQSKSTPSMPKEVAVRLPLSDSSITTAKFISNNPNVFYAEDEYYSQMLKKSYPPLIPVETNPKDGINLSSANFTGFSRVKNLYISGHQNGAITFWDASCPFFIPILQLKQQVSVINIDGPSLLYQKHIASEISTGITSLQFITCSLHGFKKSILAVGTKDSSVLALDSETGDTLSTGTIRPKKPSKALFMQLLGSITKDSLDLREGNHIEDATKQLYSLLCSEKALYIYSFEHALQGIKKVLYKRKFNSSSCCFASTFHSPSDIGLLLLFTTGKVELRSLPDLSLIVKTKIRGFTYSPPKLNSFSDSQICCSSKGDLVLVNGDQEIFVMSLLVQRNIFRHLDSISCLYRKERMLSQEELVPGPAIRKEMKKGIFSSVIKDFTSSKEKHMPLMEKEDPKESIQELSIIFSHANFPLDTNNNDNPSMDETRLELNLDDIDLEDRGEKRREQSIFGVLNKKNLAGKFQALKGRGKEIKGNSQKASDKEEQQDEKDGAVDQIKKKYGFSSSSNETGIAKLAESRLQENTRKLQGIELRTSEMQNTAKSFLSLAKQVLRTTEQDKRS